MTDENDVLPWLQDELRKDPGSPHLKKAISRIRRLRSARGNAPRPPARKLDDARRILLDERLLQGGHDLSRRPKLPIDHVVRDFVRDGTIVERLDSDVFLTARQAVIDGCMWGDYYARFKLLAQPTLRGQAKMIQEDAAAAIGLLAEFISEHGTSIDQVQRESSGNDLKAGHVIRALSAARDALTDLSLDAVAVTSRSTGGAPGKPWRVGFVWGIGLGWRDLTGRRASPSSRDFMRFLEEGHRSIATGDQASSDDWTSAVRTATSRFQVGDEAAWLKRPGDEGT